MSSQEVTAEHHVVGTTAEQEGHVSPQRAAAAVAADASSAAASPQKSLNANAKAFKPKLDGTTIQEAQLSQTIAIPPTAAKSTTKIDKAATTPIQRTPSAPQLRAPPSMPIGTVPAAMMFGLSPVIVPTTPPTAGAARVTPLTPLQATTVGGIPPFAPPVGMIPPSPMFFGANLATPSVNVGNASLAALRSKEPPKFVCVLLVGLPSSGKTVIGRDVVASLNSDKLGWTFFSGSDYLKEGNKQSAWESAKDVFDALNNKLDAQLAKQSIPEERIKGLVIDKNCRGVEDLFYLSSLLKSKGVPLVGVVSLDVKDDDTLIRRMGKGEDQIEKVRYHRVIQARIIESAKVANLYRSVDATKPREAVAQAVRTMVLGCSVNPQAVRPLCWTSYCDSTCQMVESYEEYASVMSTLFSLAKTSSSNPQRGTERFPGFTDYTPLSTRELSEPSKVALLRKEYSVRRKIDGTKHVCVFDGQNFYLVPRHMRAILKVNKEAWFGQLANIGKLVLDGDLVRQIKDKAKEKFIVYDVLFWSDAQNPNVNLVRGAPWKERQERLYGSLCHESEVFYKNKNDCVICHQRSEPWEKALELLDTPDYPSDGLVLQPHMATHQTFVWRPPQAITCDLRLGTLISAVQPEVAPVAAPTVPTVTPTTPQKMERQASNVQVETVKTFTVEAFDKDHRQYVRLGTETVEVRRNDVVEGCFCICGLAFESDGSKHWVFHRARYDVACAAYKSHVDDLLANCLIPRSRLVTWLIEERLVPQATVEVPKPVVALSGGPTAGVSRGAFGSALEAPKPTPSATAVTTAVSAAKLCEQLKLVVPAAQVKKQQQRPAEQQNDLRTLETMIQTVHVVHQDTTTTTTTNAVKVDKSNDKQPASAHDEETTRKGLLACGECKKSKKQEDLRIDPKDKRHYCYACWAKAGTEFCADCGEFAKGYRETLRRQTTPFYCDECWRKYSAKKRRESARKGDDATKKDEAPVSKDDKETVAKREPKRTREPKKEKSSETPAPEGEAQPVAAAKRERRRPEEKKAEAAQPSTAAEAPIASDEAQKGEEVAKADDGQTEKKRRRRGGRGRRKRGPGDVAGDNDSDGPSGDDQEKLPKASDEKPKVEKPNDEKPKDEKPQE